MILLNWVFFVCVSFLFSLRLKREREENTMFFKVLCVNTIPTTISIQLFLKKKMKYFSKTFPTPFFFVCFVVVVYLLVCSFFKRKTVSCWVLKVRLFSFGRKKRENKKRRQRKRKISFLCHIPPPKK